MASSSGSGFGGAGGSTTALSAEQKNAAMNSERSFLTRLFQAALDGDFDQLKTQVESYQQQQQQQENNNETNSSSSSCLDIISQFRDGNKRTALHFACQSMAHVKNSPPDKTKKDIVQDMLEWLLLLLQQSSTDDSSNNSIPALLRIKDKEGLTPLMLAARVSDPATAERRVLAILVADANGQQQQQQSTSSTTTTASPPPTTTTTTTVWPKLGLARSKVAGATALHYAASAGATGTTIEALLPVSGPALLTFSKRGGTPLHWAAAVAPPANYSTTIAALVNAMEKSSMTTTTATSDALGNFIHASQKPSASSSDESLIPPALHLACAAMNQEHAMTLLQICVDKKIPLLPTLSFVLPPFANSILIMAADLNLVRFLDWLCHNPDVQQAMQTEPAPSTTTGSSSSSSSSVSLFDWLRDYPNEQGLTALQVAAREGHVGCVWILMGSQNHSQEDARQYMESFQKEHAQQQSSKQANVSKNLEKTKLGDDDDVLSNHPLSGSGGSSSVSQAEEQAAKVEAARLLQVVSTGNQEKAQTFKLQGNTHFAAQAWQEAIAAYSLAIQEDPTNAALYSNRSAAYHHLDVAAAGASSSTKTTNSSIGDNGNNDDGVGSNEKGAEKKEVVATVAQQRALSDAWLCRALRPDWPKASFRLATALSAIGRFEDAAVAAWEGLQQDSDNDELKKLLQDAVKKGREQHLKHRANKNETDDDKDNDEDPQ